MNKRVSVFGLGYVGSVTAGCLARMGQRVIGVDVNAEKVAAFNAGRSPVLEPGLDDYLQQAASHGAITPNGRSASLVIAWTTSWAR